MGKRPTVEVDEEYLKEVMAGGAVLRGKERFRPEAEEQPPVKEEKSIDTQQPEPVEPKDTAKSARRRKDEGDYEQAFLQRKAGVPRRQSYISSHLYEKISRFLPVIASGLSITGYIDNILSHHLEQYKEDINELYGRKSQKPF